MKTLWSKGLDLDASVAAFTVGDDREVDAHFATADVLGSLAHVETLRAAGILDAHDADLLQGALRALWPDAVSGDLRPAPEDEDIHSALERVLTDRLGTPARRVHTARSRNDQIAVDVALYLRDAALQGAAEAQDAAEALATFARAFAHLPLPGMTHLQPAMPSSFGLWALGYASLLLDDARAFQAAFDAANACPLGSAAGYGVPERLVPLDRALTARLLAFDRPVEPVTAVQAGRGKVEAAALFAFTQAASTCARLAADVVLYVNPLFGWLRLPDAFTTGSSIMPQKKNPDVMELVRGHAHGVRAALVEVLSLPASLPGGYHRDFQLLKAPTLRGIAAGRAVLQIVAHVAQRMEPNPQAAQDDCTPELYATHRALELVTAGAPFRDAYRQVAAEVLEGTLPPGTSEDLPPIQAAFADFDRRAADLRRWTEAKRASLDAAQAHLLGSTAP